MLPASVQNKTPFKYFSLFVTDDISVTVCYLFVTVCYIFVTCLLLMYLLDAHNVLTSSIFVWNISKLTMQTKLFIKTVKLFESISNLDLHFTKKRGFVPLIGFFFV